MSVLPLAPDSCWPVDTTCTPGWDAYDVEPDPNAVPPTVGVPRYSPAEKALAVSLAGQTMRMLTGYRVGGCPVTVRPCRAGCSEKTWRPYTATPWFPVSLGGNWLNIGCGSTCSALAEVHLGGSASAVTSVVVDGVVLSPSAYRLDPGGHLVRTDGGLWPTTQDLTLPSTAPGTWAVTYVPGVVVDGLGAAAAGALAGEYVKACTGDEECVLPMGVTQVVRNGVSLSITPGLFPEGQTGLAVVDTYVRRWNPHGLQSPPTVWSPDIRRPRAAQQ